MGVVVPVMAQRITRINPQNIALRAVSACGFTNVLTVGDSATVLIFRDSIHGWDQPNPHLDRSITLMAASYIDSLHGIIGGSKGTISWTSDGGVTWQQSNSTTNGAIRYLASNGAGAVIGVGDSGVIVRTTDGGKSWTRIKSLTQAQLNAVTFGTPNAGTIVGNDSIILMTTDAGQSWTRFINPYDLSQVAFLLDSINYAAVAMNGADRVWVTLREPIFVMPFIRGGIDPSIADISQNLCIGCGPATTLLYCAPFVLPLTIYGTDDFIYYQEYTSNRWFKNFVTVQGDADGHTDVEIWRVLGGTCIRRPHIGTGGEDVLMFVCGENGFFGYTANVAFNYPFPLSSRSLLSYLSTSFTPFGTPDALPPHIGYAVGSGGGVARTVDGGFSWSTLTIPGDTSGHDTLNTVCKIDSNTAIVVGWNGRIQRTSDAGLTWATLQSNTNERLHGIAFPTPSTGIIVGDNETILRSTDTGKTWSSDGVAKDQSEQKFLYAVDFVNASTGVAAGESGTIFRTTDGGLDWVAKDNVEHGFNDYRQIQAFADGTIYARASTGLLVTHDAGLNWGYVTVPGGGDTLGFGFYNSLIGIVGQRVTSSALVPDTAFFRYTINGGSTWSNEIAVPIWNYNRILFHWLNEHQVLLYGIQGFTVLLDITASGVRQTVLHNTPDFQLSPNPSSGEVHITFATKSVGPVTIELWDASGKKIATLLSGEEEAGDHSCPFILPKDLHGAYFVRLTRDGGTSEQGIVIE